MQVKGVLTTLVTLACVTLGGSPAMAAGPPICTIADPNAVELSGLAVSNGFLYALNDGNEDLARRGKVFKLSTSCASTDTNLPYAGAGPLDPEDLALGPDGTLWIGDIGDNDRVRPTIALWKIGASQIEGPYRLSYPDGKYDAEALLIGSDGLPIIVTKARSEPKTLVYKATGQLTLGSRNGVPLERAGEISLPKSETSNLYGPPGRLVVTGAATSPDRSKVVLRTYADAFEWPVSDDDVVKSITTGMPKVTPLPDEPMGEAITYSPDGTQFWTVSETAQVPDESQRTPSVLSYSPGTAEGQPDEPMALPEPQDKPWWSQLLSTTDRLYALIACVGALGVLLVVLGVTGIVNARKRRHARRRGYAQYAADDSPTAALAHRYSAHRHDHR